MKKIALILAVVLMLSLVLVACDNGTEESKATSDVVSTDTSVEESTEVSEEESEEVSEEESKGPVYAEGTTDIDRTLTATVVTQGLTYNELTSTRTDGWAAAEGKLTDGTTDPNGASSVYFFGTGAPVEVIIDLGEKVEGLADFSIYAVHGDYGISPISSVQYYVSDDGENWLPVAPAVLAEDCEEVGTTGLWVAYDYKLELEKGVSGQYVKFSITPANHVWLAEVAAVVYK